ncbi:MAG: HAMP domain-containing sensor histidine kinase [Candidatus Saccharimonadales bacterium]
MPEEVSVARIKQFFKSSTARLSLSYLLVIMLMSVCFSFVLYSTSVHELGRQTPPPSLFGLQEFDNTTRRGSRINDFFERRVDEGRRSLILHLVILNLLVLAGGAIFSYYLSRQTLQPIEASMEAQSQFVSDASHELRTPLTAIQIANEVALRKDKISDVEVRDILRQNIDDAIRLQNLAEGLLRLAKLDNTDLRLVLVHLSDVVSDAVNAVVGDAVKKHIKIEDRVPNIVVNGDQASLARALVTILDNAIKYSPPKSLIKISTSQRSKFVDLKISDEGPGIAPEHLPHIFDRFYRADQARSQQTVSGYGIGLSLAKKIIDQHGGDIIVKTTKDKGTSFIIRLPIS